MSREPQAGAFSSPPALLDESGRKREDERLINQNKPYICFQNATLSPRDETPLRVNIWLLL